MSISNEEVESWFENRGISVTWSLDQRGAMAAVGTEGQPGYVPAIPAQTYSR